MEFYRHEIERITEEEGRQVALVDNKPVPCCKGDNLCEVCELHHRPNNAVQGCGVSRTKWLMAEHTEKPKLSEAEMTFLKALNIKCWIARDADGALYFYSCEPWIEEDAWATNDDRAIHIGLDFFLDVHFEFITWKSNRAWSVSELLELEVK